MNLGVQSYPELYTTLIGWQQYQNLWHILTHTGIAFVPFLVLFLKGWVMPLMGQTHRTASLVSLKWMEIAFILMILVIMIAVQPLMTLKPQALNFQSTCSQKIARPGDTGTTYDEVFKELQTVKLPLFWYGLLGITQGITRAASINMGCPDQLRQHREHIHSLRIQSPELRAEAQDFMQHCWLQAKSRLTSKKPDISELIRRYGYQDLEWAGSRILQQLSGYYDQLFAPYPVKGFPYRPDRDFEQGKFQKWGTPNCKDWWVKPTQGLYARLQEEVPANLREWLRKRFDADKAMDAAVRALLTNSIALSQENKSSKAVGLSNMSSLADKQTTVPKLHQWLQSTIQNAPILQATLLMFCYTLLPLAMVLANYRIAAIIPLASLIVSIITWRYWWHIATHLEDWLIKALYPSELSYLTQATWLDGRILLFDSLIGIIYLGLPLIWSVLMVWLGSKASQSVQGIMGRLVTNS